MWIKPELFQLKAVSAPSEPERLLPELVRERFGMAPSALRIVSRAVDARRGAPTLVYSLLLEFPQPPRTGGKWTPVDEAELIRLEHPDPGLPDCARPPESPLVVGTGPCGIFAALGLALEKEEPELSHRRCLTHPFRQRASIAGKRTTLFAAAMQVLSDTAYEALRYRMESKFFL